MTLLLVAADSHNRIVLLVAADSHNRIMSGETYKITNISVITFSVA